MYKKGMSQASQPFGYTAGSHTEWHKQSENMLGIQSVSKHRCLVSLSAGCYITWPSAVNS